VPRIAIVEDDPHLRQLVGLALSRRGYEVVSFTNGQDALDLISQGGYDLVLSDVKMPRLDGIGLVEGLRRQWSKTELPIILSSVLDEEDDILRGYEAGANEYMVKPFRPSVLQAKVAQLLHERPTRRGAPTVATTRPSASDKLPMRFDAYTLTKKLGEGGMGSVFEARRDSDQKVVALKLLNREVTEDRTQLARYFREIATLTWVESPHVVRIVDAGFAQGRYYLCMELVPGKTALALLREQGQFTIREALRVGVDIAKAVDALQAKGLVHRDIKPGNIVITPEKRAVLIDFGLAKREKEEPLTSTSEILGTAEYMAPEVVKGQVPDAVSDLYAIGCTLYELLSGERPTPGATPSEVFNNLLSGWVATPVTELRPDLPYDVGRIVTDLLEPDPACRPQEPATVATRLEAMLRTLPA
jgi:eukaryotic-like serine/threonine-protein kinase